MRDYFDRYIRDDRHLAAVVAYIHANPVKAGLVDYEEAWPHSSARLMGNADLAHRMNFGSGRGESERDARGPREDQGDAGVPPAFP